MNSKRVRYVIGVHSGINASAAIGTSDGRLLFAVQEERISRKKNHIGFPGGALRQCLKAVGARPDDVEIVAHGSRSVWLHELTRDQFLSLLSQAHARQSLQGRLRRRVHTLRHPQPTASAMLRNAVAPLGLRGSAFKTYDHHATHAATAYFGLKTDDLPYLVLTCDGQGDGASATVSIYERGQPRELARTGENDSLGLPYMWTTFEHGFIPHEDEYKLMGMAPYASRTRADEVAALYKRLIWLDPANPLKFREVSGRGFFLSWPEFRRTLERRRFDHIFAGLQQFTEEALAEWLGAAVAHTGVSRVLAAGGVFMNVKANQRLAELSSVASLDVFPSCGDESLAIGAFYRAAAEIGATVEPLHDYFLGDAVDFSSSHATAASTIITQHDETASVAADLLSCGEIVARCVGRMEFGARALGHRSILAPANDPTVIRRLNSAIKRRDFWMPFAPAVLAERSEEYLQARQPRSPFMMMSYPTRVGSRDRIVAAIHPADFSARAQIVYERENPDLYRVLKEYEKRTGEAAVLNTSFNLHGEPIVRDAADALRVFESTELRYLTFPNALLAKVGPCS